jgi:hypothetical protein
VDAAGQVEVDARAAVARRQRLRAIGGRYLIEPMSANSPTALQIKKADGNAGTIFLTNSKAAGKKSAASASKRASVAKKQPAGAKKTASR